MSKKARLKAELLAETESPKRRWRKVGISVIVSLLSMFLVIGALGQWDILPKGSFSGFYASPVPDPTPTPTPQLSKSYIYAGGGGRLDVPPFSGEAVK